jgi:hypothetical protein
MMPLLETFVSFVTVESKFADLLQARLDRDFIGLVRVFVSKDATSIPVGSKWLDQLVAALNRSHLQLVICSSESVRRPWIHYEAGGAAVRGIEVIPLCHSGIRPEQLPVPLSMSEGVILTDPRGIEQLYTKISVLLGSSVPPVDFAALAAEFQTLENEYRNQQHASAAAASNRSEESIATDPSVLCVSSAQYLELGFENQLQQVLDAFPKDLRHERVTASADLERILRQGRVDIVHIAAFVCPRSGVLYFNRVELPSGANATSELDFVRPEALAALLRDARTRLVVIGSGDSLALATTLLAVTNVIAPRDIVSSHAMALWVKAFYSALRLKTLAEACEYAGMASNAPMRLLTQQLPTEMRLWPDQRTATQPTGEGSSGAAAV